MAPTAVETTIASWGNSEAVRIPRDVLRYCGMRKGDKVTVGVDEQGGIVIKLVPDDHRRVVPDRNVTFESLFGSFEQASRWQKADVPVAWEDDEVYSVEKEALS